jgi:hypothetical protein
MNKALYLAAALALLPLPVLAQQGQTGGGSQPQQAQTAQGGQSAGASDQEAYGEQGAYDEEGGGRFGRGDILDRLADSGLGERIQTGIERVEDACGPDIERYCGDISPGEGRIAACVRAYSDRLSRRCRFTLWRVSRTIRQNVQSIADECLGNIQQQCGNAGNIGDCAVQKSSSLSPTCQKVVQAVHEAGQKIAGLKNVHVYSSDGVDLGPVVEVKHAPDGKLQSVQIQVGRFLGIGDKVVTIDADKLQHFADGLKIRLNAGEVRNMPEAQQQQQSKR